MLAAAAVTLAACAAPAPMLQPEGAVDAAVPEGLESFYAQTIEWSDCGDNFDCTSVEVPMSYDDPTGETIEIAAKRHNHTEGDAAVGTMFVNPGGPGASGLEMVESSSFYFSRDLRENLDIIGFDPRGVGESHGVRCYDQAQLEEYYAQTYDVETDAGWDEFVADGTAYGEACLENTGPLMEFLDTVTAAKDLDILRGTLGESTLTYLGFSYGTFLGATYAELYPERVGRLVLDGAVDPALSYSELAAGQNVGFERAYRSYLEDCLQGASCPFTGTVDDAWDRTVELLDELAANPVDVGDPDRPVTDSDLINAIIISMYGTDWWPTLSESIAMYLDDGDASQIRLMSDIAADLDEDGNYPLDEGAYTLINCLDYPVTLDRAAITADAEELEEQNDLFGPYFGYGEVSCATLPFQSTADRQPIAAEGVPPIVVIGTTRDPATPYEWAESMADQLSSGVFLSYDGDGHTAYGKSDCIDAPVDEFLLDGTVPEDGLSC
jgi:pimeloyl-ACP methyl ester carboxylesterase